MKKTLTIAFAVIAVIAVFITSMFISVNNTVINKEEQLMSANTSIEIAEKRRVDLVYNLADTVQEYAKHEKSTLKEIAEMRSQAKSGDIENVQLQLSAVAEAYPDLKASENYKSLMTELSITENMIKESRENYNIQVKAYNKYIRQFPNSFILNILGYEKLDLTYLEFNAPSDAPQNLFNK